MLRSHLHSEASSCEAVPVSVDSFANMDWLSEASSCEAVPVSADSFANMEPEHGEVQQERVVAARDGGLQLGGRPLMPLTSPTTPSLMVAKAKMSAAGRGCKQKTRASDSGYSGQHHALAGAGDSAGCGGDSLVTSSSHSSVADSPQADLPPP